VINEPVAPQYVDLNNDEGVSVFDFTGFSNNFGTGIVYQTGIASLVAIPVEDVVTLEKRLSKSSRFPSIPHGIPSPDFA
jgi:hypothetical protein